MQEMNKLFYVLFTLQTSGDFISQRTVQTWGSKEEGWASEFGYKTDIIATTVALNSETEKQ